MQTMVSRGVAHHELRLKYWGKLSGLGTSAKLACTWWQHPAMLILKLILQVVSCIMEDWGVWGIRGVCPCSTLSVACCRNRTPFVHRQAHSIVLSLCTHLNQLTASQTIMSQSVSCACSCIGASRSFFSLHSALFPPSYLHSQSCQLCLRHPCLHLSFSCVVCVSGRRLCMWGFCPGPCVNNVQHSGSVCGLDIHQMCSRLELIEPLTNVCVTFFVW